MIYLAFLAKVADLYNIILTIGFPTRRDSATFWDKGTEVPSLSQDKGTMGQAKNLAEESVPGHLLPALVLGQETPWKP